MALSEILCYVVEGRFHIPPNPVAVSLAILAIVVSLYLTKYHSKKIRRTLPFLFLVVTVGTLGIYGQERSSPAGSPVPISTLSPAQPTQALSPDERIRRLEEEVNLALALKDERIQSINERSENIYKWLQFFGAFAALVLVFFTARDIVQRWKEQKRQKGIDEIVMGMMKLQKSGAERQDRLGELQLKQMETSPNQQFQAVENVNQVIEVVRKTLAFRLEQEEKFVEALKEIERIREERDKIKKQKLAQALGICEHFHTCRAW